MTWKSSYSNLHSRYSVITLVLVFIAGIVFWGGFNWSMELTNTESFCISCHEMKQNVYQEYKNTVHYSNRTGVRATCPDCHVPKEWIHKVVRKVKATNELYHWIRGSIDSREKFQNKREALANHVWGSMVETNSRECRNCHDDKHMEVNKQQARAQKIHLLAEQWGGTCIDCHQGIAHTLPDSFDKEAQIDDWHKKFEQQKIACYECHENLQKKDTEEW